VTIYHIFKLDNTQFWAYVTQTITGAGNYEDKCPYLCKDTTRDSLVFKILILKVVLCDRSEIDYVWVDVGRTFWEEL
jgi:hypothetical protein